MTQQAAELTSAALHSECGCHTGRLPDGGPFSRPLPSRDTVVHCPLHARAQEMAAILGQIVALNYLPNATYVAFNGQSKLDAEMDKARHLLRQLDALTSPLPMDDVEAVAAEKAGG